MRNQEEMGLYIGVKSEKPVNFTAYDSINKNKHLLLGSPGGGMSFTGSNAILAEVRGREAIKIFDELEQMGLKHKNFPKHNKENQKK